jgi:hypothetical protein
MEKCYVYLNKGIYKAVEHIVAQEKPEVGEYYFDLACAPDEDGNQLFNVELIIDKDGTWGGYGATIYNENYMLISIAKIVDGEYSLEYEIVKRETFKTMKSIESKNFTVEEALKEIHTVNELLKVENVVTIEDENGNIVDTMLKGLKDTEGNGNKLVRITKRKATRWLVVKLV